VWQCTKHDHKQPSKIRCGSAPSTIRCCWGTYQRSYMVSCGSALSAIRCCWGTYQRSYTIRCGSAPSTIRCCWGTYQRCYTPLAGKRVQVLKSLRNVTAHLFWNSLMSNSALRPALYDRDVAISYLALQSTQKGRCRHQSLHVLCISKIAFQARSR
jgi:hypothetical protein